MSRTSHLPNADQAPLEIKRAKKRSLVVRPHMRVVGCPEPRVLMLSIYSSATKDIGEQA